MGGAAAVTSRAAVDSSRGTGTGDGRLARAYFGLAGLTYGLIVLGALVRAHGAGLSCPDWPLCFGDVIPRLDFKVAFEFGHRVLAGGIAILFALLAATTLRRPALGPALRSALAVAAAILAIQIVLGGLTVLKLLASWTVTSHLVTGNAFALALVLIGRRAAELAEPAGRGGAGSMRVATARERLATTAVALLLACQIVVGGLVSSNYAGLVCPDWPACIDGQLFPTFFGIRGLHVLHRTLGYALVSTLPLAAHLTRGHPALAGWLRLASGIALCQVAAGIANVLLRLPVEITALHSALAAALVCTLGIGVQIAFRRRPS